MPQLGEAPKFSSQSLDMNGLVRHIVATETDIGFKRRVSGTRISYVSMYSTLNCAANGRDSRFYSPMWGNCPTSDIHLHALTLCEPKKSSVFLAKSRSEL